MVINKGGYWEVQLRKYLYGCRRRTINYPVYPIKLLKGVNPRLHFTEDSLSVHSLTVLVRL